MEKKQYYKICEYMPTLYGIQIPGKRGKLFSVLYTAGGKGVHPTVLLLHGIPGNEQNLDLAQSLRSKGFHVITFHYSGCFGSDGNYTLTHNIEDANAVLDFILQDTQYGFDKKCIFAVGHSIGGFVGAHLTAMRKEVKGSALLMPFNAGHIFNMKDENSEVYERLKGILTESADWLCGASIEKFMAELLENRAIFPLENLAPRLRKKPLLCVEATFDWHTPPEYHCRALENAILSFSENKLKILRMATDHFASGKRQELINAVVSYFCKLSDVTTNDIK